MEVILYKRESGPIAYWFNKDSIYEIVATVATIEEAFEVAATIEEPPGWWLSIRDNGDPFPITGWLISKAEIAKHAELHYRIENGLCTICGGEKKPYENSGKTWVIRGLQCIKCGSKTPLPEQSYEGAHIEAQKRRSRYTTAHGGHRPGAKIEYGPPTPLGRDYEE